MRITDLVPKTHLEWHELLMQALATVLAVWVVTAVLGCMSFSTISPAQAQSIIQGSK